MVSVGNGYPRELVPRAGGPAVALRRERLPQLVGLKVDADAVLGNLKIAVIGVGSVGLAVAQSLARLQVKELLLVDRGRLKTTSVQTHPVLPRCRPRPPQGRACRPPVSGHQPRHPHPDLL